MNKAKPDPERKVQAGEAQPDAEQAEIARLKAENAQLKDENAQHKEGLRREHELYLRSLADFENYRKRIERERAKAANEGKREMVLSLLNFLDDFERALKHIDESPASVSEGLRAIHRRLAGLLEAQNVTPYESVGQPFDPMLHDAVGSVESDEREPGTVFDELSRGYYWGDELLRPARVRVAR
ncbi:MAG: nucleotide exchange factor GrpE [Acidobacteria bacterium]|nr:nucleotide exchange factor GrpE [Acidobacteriota bacterium]